MAKPNRDRSMPRTPRPHDDSADLADAGAPPVPPGRDALARRSDAGGRSESREGSPAPGGREPRPEPEYLMKGTRCVAGHARGRERDAGPIGELPTARTTWIGVSLLLWCGAGLYFLLDPRWMSLAITGVLLWLGFSALVQRRAGHRGRCWRTRAWRHAWGGLVPSIR